MGKIFINNINEAQVQAIVQAELLANPPSAQLPAYPSAPVTTVEGTMYRNTTDGKVYVLENGVWVKIDTTVDNYSKILSSGLTHIVLASEHNLTSISGVKVYNTSDQEVIVGYSVNTGLTVTINSEINLNNYKLKIFS